MKIKLESKFAKTTVFFLPLRLYLSFFQCFFFGLFGKVVPVLRTQAANRLTQVVIQLSSLINPLIYCYRDHRFRNAILELLGMRKPQATSSAFGNNQFVRQKDIFRSSELPKGKCSQRLERSVSCTQTDALFSIYRTPSVITLKKSLSAPTLDTRSCSLHVLDLQQTSSFVETSAIAHCRNVRALGRVSYID